MNDRLKTCGQQKMMQIHYLIQFDVSNLEPKDDDPQQTQDQCTVTINHILWTNQIYSNLTGITAISFLRLDSIIISSKPPLKPTT